MANPLKRVSGSSPLRNNKLSLGLALATSALLFVGFLLLIQKVIQTETYYVLNTDVPTRTQVKPEMLSPITTSKDGAPPTAKTIGDVQTGEVFTKFALSAGDPLTNSNTGALEDIATGVPDSWVVTTIGVGADDAVGGRISRGYYFDLMVATEKGSEYPFVNLLALDTSVSMSNASSSNAVNTEEAKSGQTTQYTVAGTPADIAKLQQVMKKHGSDIKLVLSPRQNQYQAPALAEYQNGGSLFKYETSDGPKDLGKGTDPSFRPVKRDETGRPISKDESEKQSTTTNTPSN